ncbi:MAG: DNA repair exonuclease [Candidatus Aenigmarchaeota archaeon]|nr:DNA repair exonuclease [Candidatus Aenigmarchaeota archaeon]
MVKFAHLSDIHLGAWNSHPDLREYPLRAWETAVSACITEGVDFVVIAGDFFDTSLPPIDVMRKAASGLRRLKEAGVRAYAIAGSHDFSPTGKSMLNVLEDAGLLTNVAKISENNGSVSLEFTHDPSGAKLCGIIGRRGALEHSYFESLDRSIEKERGPKIFVFHSAVSEINGMEGQFGISAEMLPRDFDYYASGHVHRAHYDERTRIAFPGPLFPADFQELENYDSGFYIVNLDSNLSAVKRVPVNLCGVSVLKIDANGKTPEQVRKEAEQAVARENLEGRILLLKIEGTIEGRLTDINLKPAIAAATGKGAVSVKKSLKVTTRDIEQTQVRENASIEDMEREIITKNSGKMKLTWLGKEGTERLVMELMARLQEEKQEDESEKSYAERIKSSGRKVLGI